MGERECFKTVKVGDYRHKGKDLLQTEYSLLFDQMQCPVKIRYLFYRGVLYLCKRFDIPVVLIDVSLHRYRLFSCKKLFETVNVTVKIQLLYDRPLTHIF